MKISFNDQSLQTTFEYPSESSLVQEAEEKEQEEEEEEEVEEEEEEEGAVTPFKLFLPRATFINNVGPESPWLPEGSSCECHWYWGGNQRAAARGWGRDLTSQGTLCLQTCLVILPSTPWPSASGRSRLWSQLPVRRSLHRRRSW